MNYRNAPMPREEFQTIHARLRRGLSMKEDIERLVDCPDPSCPQEGGVAERKDLMTLFWMRDAHQPSYLLMEDQTGMKGQMKTWRKQAKKGHLHIHPDNCPELTYKGRKYYGFTLTSIRDGEVVRGIDPVALHLFGYMCDGLTYWMTAKKNRDNIVKYVMKGINATHPSESCPGPKDAQLKEFW